MMLGCMSDRVLRSKRLTKGFFAKADHWAGVDEAANPWWLKNVRLYQNMACEAMDERVWLLCAYLEMRKRRQA